MNDTQLPSVSELGKLSLTDLETLTRSTVGEATRRWLLVGRCLLVLSQGGRLDACGCSGPTQYAGLLGIRPRDARDCKRVARSLEDLPLLRAAAEAGRIGWGALCAVTEKATPETDARWLEISQNYILAVVERLVEANPRGELPADPETVPALVPEESWLHLKVPTHVATMFQQALRRLSFQARTPVSAALCQELVLAEFLAGMGADAAAVEKMRAEARKDTAAQRRPGAGKQLLLGEVSAMEAQVDPSQGERAVDRSQVERAAVGAESPAADATTASDTQTAD